ncbi:MAG: LamG domain-containing protein [Flavobacteriales bacterium]|nr:LamG domain-containing protein [Flavobacteriales bacterium]
MYKALASVLFLMTELVGSGQSGPVFHWTLDESSGTTAHSIGGHSDGALIGGTWAPSAGHHQGACRFDGVDDRIILGSCDLTNGAGAITLSVWVKPDFITGMERTVIAKTLGTQAQDHIWSVSFVNATALRFRLRAGITTHELTTANSSIFSGSWYHVVASYDGASMRIHLNGALMAESNTSGSIGFHPQAPASIGALSTGARPMSAWIDDVRIYDRGLEQNEIIDILLEPELTTAIHMDRPYPLDAGRWMVPKGAWRDLQIRDATGRLIHARRVLAGTDILDLGDIPTGLYLICLSGDGTRTAWPVVVP